MDKETIIREGLVGKPFEARVIDEQLRARVLYFKQVLAQKNKSKFVKKIRIGRINV